MATTQKLRHPTWQTQETIFLLVFSSLFMATTQILIENRFLEIEKNSK